MEKIDKIIKSLMKEFKIYEKHPSIAIKKITYSGFDGKLIFINSLIGVGGKDFRIAFVMSPIVANYLYKYLNKELGKVKE